MREQIHVRLLEESVEAWAPVRAERVGVTLYRLYGPMPADQIWEFAPDTIVRVQKRELSCGPTLVAVARIAWTI